MGLTARKMRQLRGITHMFIASGVKIISELNLTQMRVRHCQNISKHVLKQNSVRSPGYIRFSSRGLFLAAPDAYKMTYFSAIDEVFVAYDIIIDNNPTRVLNKLKRG